MPLGRVLSEPSPLAGVNAPSQVSVGLTAGLILERNGFRKEVVIQNTGLTVLKLTFGETSPTQTVYHVALKGCSAADDGTGSVMVETGWVGPIRAISSAAGGTCVLFEKSTGNPNWQQAGDQGINA